ENKMGIMYVLLNLWVWNFDGFAFLQSSFKAFPALSHVKCLALTSITANGWTILLHKWRLTPLIFASLVNCSRAIMYRASPYTTLQSTALLAFSETLSSVGLELFLMVGESGGWWPFSKCCNEV